MDLRRPWRVVRNLTIVLSILAPIQALSPPAQVAISPSSGCPSTAGSPGADNPLRGCDKARRYSLAPEIAGLLLKGRLLQTQAANYRWQRMLLRNQEHSDLSPGLSFNRPRVPTIFPDFSVSYDSTPFTQSQLTQDLNTVCSGIGNTSAPTLTQQAEYVVSQVFRTMCDMDNQGTRGSLIDGPTARVSPTGKRAMIAGVDIRGDSAYSDCCEVVGSGKNLFGLREPAANQYPS